MSQTNFVQHNIFFPGFSPKLDIWRINDENAWNVVIFPPDPLPFSLQLASLWRESMSKLLIVTMDDAHSLWMCLFAYPCPFHWDKWHKSVKIWHFGPKGPLLAPTELPWGGKQYHTLVWSINERIFKNNLQGFGHLDCLIWRLGPYVDLFFCLSIIGPTVYGLQRCSRKCVRTRVHVVI